MGTKFKRHEQKLVYACCQQNRRKVLRMRIKEDQDIFKIFFQY